MKMAFVALVLFVGYNSGVIVPSVVSKAINQSIRASSLNISKEISTEKNLEKSNKIDEKELFQTAADKENIVNERSFIFINQRFKTPLRNQLYNSQTHNLNKPFAISERLPQVNVIPSSSVQINVSPLKELFIPNIKIKGAVKPRYGPPSYKYVDEKLKNSFRDDIYTLQKAVQEGVQIKPAVLRPLSKSSDEKYDKKSSASNSEETMKHYKNKKTQEINSYARHRLNYNYGFPSSYQTHGSVFRNNDLSIKSDDISNEGSLVTDNIGNLSPLDLNDEDKFLERYIKETLEEFDVNDMIVNKSNDPNKCQKCKSNGNKTKAQTDTIENCKCHKIQDPHKADIKKPHKNRYESDNASGKPSLASNENDRLFAYGDDKIIDDALFNDNTIDMFH